MFNRFIARPFAHNKDLTSEIEMTKTKSIIHVKRAKSMFHMNNLGNWVGGLVDTLLRFLEKKRPRLVNRILFLS